MASLLKGVVGKEEFVGSGGTYRQFVTTVLGRSRDTAASLPKTFRHPQFQFGLAVLLPTLVFYALFAFLPIVRGLWLSVTSYNVLHPSESEFVGLGNFRNLLLNPLLVDSIRNTLAMAAIEFISVLPLALLLSVCLVNVRRWTNLYQGFIFVPVVVSLVAVSLLFRVLMDPEVGTFNQILRSIGLPTSQWLASSASALPTVAGIDVWKSLGFYVVLLTAGMLNIPGEFYDAARVDGVNEWQRFWFVTLPLLSHTLILVMVLLAIGVLQVYTSVVVLTNGGPGSSTYVFNLLIVEEAFTNMRFGTASAAALIQLVFIFAVSIVQLKVLRPNWSY